AVGAPVWKWGDGRDLHAFTAALERGAWPHAHASEAVVNGSGAVRPSDMAVLGLQQRGQRGLGVVLGRQWQRALREEIEGLGQRLCSQARQTRGQAGRVLVRRDARAPLQAYGPGVEALFRLHDADAR